MKPAAARSGPGKYVTLPEIEASTARGLLLGLALRQGLRLEEPVRMESSRSCEAFLKGCPIACVGRDRFIERAERCLTFDDECPQPLPCWIDRAWLNSLAGCVRCQSVCAVDRPFLSRNETLRILSNEETKTLLQAPNPAGIPLPVAKRLETIDLAGIPPCNRAQPAVPDKRVRGCPFSFRANRKGFVPG